ncbi:type II toxin-antitoxin system RelE/ParE family toxin [Rhizobium metallidurans]|uniref:type II toxin-antitoxin system RelE/ParE family toxin n=1 Tax=Rhizobium metallidurans TaxID=1265931 RepID=UPI001608D03A|nr:type II toxin-antitoxin system RelE/ParE family toxin [Rhizobium metallidurans]
MIVGFRNKQTEGLFLRRDARHFPADVVERARRKLMALDAAISLDDLRVPPSNRLEALKGSRAGQHSIRVNDQWRICFVWKDGNADNVEFCDYH